MLAEGLAEGLLALRPAAPYGPEVVFGRNFDRLMKSRPVRLAQLVLGVALMLAGPIAALPTPPPVGTLIFGLGLALVLRNSRWAKRRYLRWTRGHPKVRRVVDFGLRRKQVVAPAPDKPAGRRGWWRRQRLREQQERGD